MATKGKYGKIIFEDQDIEFIKANFHTLTNQQIADALGLKKTIVTTKAYELGLQRMELEYWPDAAIKYLKENYRSIGNREIVRHFDTAYPKQKGWTTSHIDKKLEQLGLSRNAQDRYLITERNRQNGRYGTPNPKLKRKPMPKIWLWLNEKTRIEIKPGQDANEVKTRYENRNSY